MRFILTIFGIGSIAFSVFAQSPNMDKLKYWNYKFDTAKTPKIYDSIKSYGQITFFRTESLVEYYRRKDDLQDSGLQVRRSYGPEMKFEIFDVSDSSICSTISKKVKLTSKCNGQEVGGDIFTVGNYIFVNTESCLTCLSHDQSVDYCRPIINYILKKVKPDITQSVKDITRQFPIKESR